MKQLGKWVERVETGSLVEAVQEIICESLLLQRIHARPDALEQLELIKRFVGEVKQFALSHPTAKLSAFLEYITLLRDYRLRLAIPRLLPVESGVFLGTAHSAKGLEFGTVFLAGVDAKNWNDRGKRELIKLPGTIVELSDWHEDILEDERRLFYVALTRAKNRLVCSYTSTNDEGREVLPSQFISELGDTIEESSKELSRDDAEKIIVSSLMPISREVLEEQELRLVRELITSRPFSFTDYKAYQLCPRQYLLGSLLRFPAKTEPRLVYGSLLHRALELFYKKYRTIKKLPSASVLQSFVDQATRGIEPFHGRQAIITQAKELLAAYYPTISEPLIPVGVEYSLTSHHVMLEDIWVTGKFDRIDPIDATARTVRIIDYKTGTQAKTRNDIEGKTKSSDGRLRDQLVFYSLLTSLDRHFPYTATEFSLLFLDDAHTFRQETFAVGAAEREALGADVVRTYREILSRTDFTHERDEYDRGCEVCELFRELV
jgi:DNA helicase-2/ATP-dependent DNA helicase PcrA